jgi:hypothetical protein
LGATNGSSLTLPLSTGRSVAVAIARSILLMVCYVQDNFLHQIAI